MKKARFAYENLKEDYKEEYIARITIRHAPQMNKREIKRVSKWLREKADEIENEHKEYAELFRANLYQV